MRYIVILLCIIIIIITLFIGSNEHFIQQAQLPYLTLDVIINPNIINIKYDKWNKSHSIDRLLDSKNIVINSTASTANTLTVIDAYTFLKSNIDSKVLTLLTDKKNIILYSPTYMKKVDISSVTKIGYYNSIDLELLYILFKSCNVPQPECIKIDTESFDKVDCIMLFCSVSNIKNLIDANRQINIITYAPDIHKLKFFIPYSNVDNVDMKMTLPKQFVGKFPVYSFITIDMLLYGSNNINLHSEYNNILNAYENDALNNYFTLYLTLFDITMKRLEDTNKYILKTIKNEYQILEQFANDDGRRFDEKYKCYNPTYIQLGLCESEYDQMGNSKLAEIWDKPCVNHNDCDFYQSNKNYKNNRGGCKDGFCEVPIGVKKISYRKYIGEPYCYNCHTKDPNCCENQKNRNKYPELNSPDYAFELDQFKRLKNFENSKL